MIFCSVLAFSQSTQPNSRLYKGDDQTITNGINDGPKVSEQTISNKRNNHIVDDKNSKSKKKKAIKQDEQILISNKRYN